MDLLQNHFICCYIILNRSCAVDECLYLLVLKSTLDRRLGADFTNPCRLYVGYTKYVKSFIRSYIMKNVFQHLPGGTEGKGYIEKSDER